MTGLSPKVQHTITFLRMTAIELRRLADGDPEIAVALGHMADQLDTEAGDLGRPT